MKALVFLLLLLADYTVWAQAPASDSLAVPQFSHWPVAVQKGLLRRAAVADTGRLRTLSGPAQPLAVRAAALRQLSDVYLSPAYHGPARSRLSLAPLLAGHKLAESRRDTAWLMDFDSAIGYFFIQNSGQASLGLTYLLAGRRLAEQCRDTARLSRFALYLAFCHNRLRQPRATIAYCQELLRYAGPAHDLDGQSHAYSTLADAYGQLGDYKEVLRNAQMALALARRAGNRLLIGTYYGNLVQPNYHEGRYREAARLLDSAYLLRDSRLDPLGRYYLHCNQAEMLSLQKRFAEAKPFADTALRHARQVSAQELEHFALALEVPILTGLGRYREALAMQQSLARLDDSTFQADANQRAEVLRTLFESEKQQAQLARQQQRIGGLTGAARLREAELRRRTGLLYALLAGAALLVALAAVLYRYGRLRQQANALLNAQKNELAVTAGKLQAANATKDRLFAIVAHDLRNPLAALTGIQTIIQRYVRRGEPERLVELGQHLEQTATTLYGVLDNVLGWALAQRGELEPRPEPVSVAALVREAAAIGQLQAAAQEIDLQVDAPPDQLLLTDRQMLRAVLRNLLGNALKFTPAGGTVALRVALESEYVTFRVEDTGPGFSAAAAASWAAAEVGPRTPDASGRAGVGLGLVVSRAFAAQLGGELSWQSRPAGGTEMTLRLPARLALATPPPTLALAG